MKLLKLITFCFALLGCHYALANELYTIDLHDSETPLHNYLWVMEDPKAEYTIKQVRKLYRDNKFTKPQNKIANFGYTNSIYWGRLALLNKSTLRQWYLVFGSSLFEKIDAYIFIDGRIQKQSSGTLVEQLFKKANFLNPTIVLALEQNQQAEIFFRFKKENSMFLNITLWHPPAFQERHTSQVAILFSYFGLLLAMLLYNLFLYISLREKVYLFYVLFVASFLILQFIQSGAGMAFLWPQWAFSANQVELLFINLSGIFAVIFAIEFLNIKNYFSKTYLGLKILTAAALLIAVIVLLFGRLRLPFALLYTASLSMQIVIIITLVTTALILWQKKLFATAKYYLLAWGFLLPAILIYIFMALALLPVNIVTQNIMVIGSALELILLSFGLAQKIKWIQIEKELALSQMLNLQSLQKTQLELQVKEKTVDLEKALVEMKKLAITDALTGLPNRRHFFDTFFTMTELAKENKNDIALLLIDIDDFKKINDQHGHATGDNALRITAAFLRNFMGAKGFVGRLGGEEFGILMQIENAFDLQVFMRMLFDAKKELYYQLANTDDEEKHFITFSVGVMRIYHHELANFHQDTLDSIMNMADQAMYMAKKGGKNQYMLLRS